MGNSLSFGGYPTAVVFGFLREVVALQEQFRTDKIVFCWDSHSSLRKDLYPEYKANRHTQELPQEQLDYEIAFRDQMLKLRKEYLPEIGYRNVYYQKGYESDDLIAEFTNCIPVPDKAIIVASDHDLYQCITYAVSCYNPQSKKMLTFQGFQMECGILPKQWALVKAMAGCRTDNVSGIKGVGERTAIKYILGQLNATTKAYQAIKSSEGATIIERNWPLVALPFEGTKIPAIQSDELSLRGWKSVCHRLGIKSMEQGFNPFPFKGARRRKHK